MQAVLESPRARASLGQWLMGADRKQHIRLVQCTTALLLVLCSVVNLLYLAVIDLAPLWPVVVWSLVLTGGFVSFWLVIRTGRNLRFADPSLTLPQMVFALCCGAAGYALAGHGRGGAFPILMVVFIFGMFSLTPKQVWRAGLFAVALMGATMVLMSCWHPAVYVPEVEISHFLMIAVMVPAITVLTGQMSSLRERLRRQKKDLAAALARIQDLATRDELTGLINRRHMVDLLEQERQRGVRSGQVFCLALVSIDDFRQLESQRGESFGEALLQAFSREAQAALRISDRLARWSGSEFLLMLSDTRSSLARTGLERLSERVQNLRMDFNAPAHALRHSVGVAEHHAGESVAETIARAARALHAAQKNNEQRVVVD